MEEFQMVINIAICDNDKVTHVLLKEYFSRLIPDNNTSFTVSYFSDGLELLSSYSNSNIYNLVILDIEMPKLSGVETAKKIQETFDFNVLFVFLTSYPENTYRNFSIQPCQYWNKPLSFNKFKEHMSYLIEEIETSYNCFSLKCISGESVVLRHQDIIYIEKEQSDSNFIFHTLYSQYIIDKMSLNPELLNESNFVSLTEELHINLQHIKNFHKKSIELSNGNILQLSSSKEKELKNAFFEYMLSN